MVLFITGLVVSLIFLIASIILAFITYQRKRKNRNIIPIDYNDRKRKKENRLLLISVLGLFFSVLVMVWTLLKEIPAPTIYPLDNEARVYNETAKVYIKSYPFLTTYYTLDGSDPEFGYIYEGNFIITETTTVSAKNKFIIFWSGLSQNTFRFESAQNITVNHVNNNGDDHTTIKDFFTYVIITIFLLIILVLAVRGELDKE